MVPLFILNLKKGEGIYTPVHYRKSGNFHSRFFVIYNFCGLILVFCTGTNVKMHFQVSNFKFFLDSNENYTTMKIS